MQIMARCMVTIAKTPPPVHDGAPPRSSFSSLQRLVQPRKKCCKPLRLTTIVRLFHPITLAPPAMELVYQGDCPLSSPAHQVIVGSHQPWRGRTRRSPRPFTKISTIPQVLRFIKIIRTQQPNIQSVKHNYHNNTF